MRPAIVAMTLRQGDPIVKVLGRCAVQCLIVDDNALFAQTARDVLERQGITIVGVASNGAEALNGVKELHPDVTLVDVDLGAESGFTVTEQLHREAPSGSSVILISARDEDELIDMIEASPAIGFVRKIALTADAIRSLVRNSAGVQKGDDR
jgi:DNA-binding NarL/FixJ family response regulator